MAGTVTGGWEGSVLYKVETTPGTPVTPDTAFGYVTAFNYNNNPALQADHAIGTDGATAFEEGIQDDSFSVDFRPTSSAFLGMATRTSRRLPSYSVHGADGTSGLIATGAKLNNLRLSIAAGGRLTVSMDFMSLSMNTNARIAPVLPTDDTLNWIELVTNLSDIVSNIDINISQNLYRVGVIAHATHTYPVSGQKRPAYVLREGPLDITVTTRFFERPSESVIADILTNISSQTFAFTGLGTGTPTFTITLANGKPSRKELSLADQGEAGWPMEFMFKTWSYA